MTNKKEFDILFSGPVGYTLNEYNEASNVIYKSLERLETLEKNSDKVIKDSVKLINKNLELQKENEKLKKEKEQIKEWVKNKISYLKNGVFLTEHKYVEGAILILKEFSKEVLDNE